MHSRTSPLLHTIALVAALATAVTVHASDASPAVPCPPQEPVAAPAADQPPGHGFAGTIVDLSCDVVRLAGGTARCDAGEHHFALRMDGERGLRALEVAQSTPVADVLHTGELTGKEVCVTGTPSPNGVLRVTGIHPLG